MFFAQCPITTMQVYVYILPCYSDFASCVLYVWGERSGKPVWSRIGNQQEGEEWILNTVHKILCKKLHRGWCSGTRSPCALALLRGAYWYWYVVSLWGLGFSFIWNATPCFTPFGDMMRMQPATRTLLFCSSSLYCCWTNENTRILSIQ